jgi:hypothetical protein
MANVKKQVQSAAVRVWLWVSPGSNRPVDCMPSPWLVERFRESIPVNQIADAIWKLARRSLKLRFPGLDRPLGSCLRPYTADVLDVAYHYGSSTQRVLRRVAAAAAEIVHAEDDLWLLGGDGEYGKLSFKRAHIGECPRLIGQLAWAIREGRAPEILDIRPSFFESGWDDRVAEMRRVDAIVREKFAFHIKLFAELGVQAYSFRDTIDVETVQGGSLCNHTTDDRQHSWVDLATDGEIEIIEAAPHVTEHGNQYHVGCYDGPARVWVHGATWMLKKVFGGPYASRGVSIVITAEAKLEELHKLLSDTSGTARPCVTGSKVLLRALLG